MKQYLIWILVAILCIVSTTPPSVDAIDLSTSASAEGPIGGGSVGVGTSIPTRNLKSHDDLMHGYHDHEHPEVGAHIQDEQERQELKVSYVILIQFINQHLIII